MKEKSSFLHAMLVCLATAMCFCVTSCGDDPETPDLPTMSTHEGDVEFNIKIPDGNGSGNAHSPAVVNPGETLNIAISQKSSYTDPDGSVFTCEPKAGISLHATLETVYAKDLSALTQVKDGYDIKTNKTGSSPVVNQTLQTFEIGGQSIVFDLSHEVFTHINSKKQSVEMPYLKLNPAELGNKAATEAKPQGRSSIAVTCVTVRPIPATRGAIIRDTTMYEVNVRFNLEVESVHTAKNEKQNIEFSVNYVGGVETETELTEPVGKLSYIWDVKGGTTDTTSPFVMTQGKEMELWMAQKSTYADSYGNVANGTPTAKIKVAAAQDTVWVKTLDELKNFIDKTGNISGTQSAAQKFGSEQQDIINIDWSYEESEAMIAGETVPMPYYALEPVKFKDLSVKELKEAVVSGKECQLYEVSARFSQKAIPKNVTENPTEVEIEYIVNYIGAVEIELVMVEYFPGGYWADPHDNMPLLYYAHVERYRTYSNGKRVGPDRFEDYGHWTYLSLGGSYIMGYQDMDVGWAYGGPLNRIEIGDSIGILTQSTIVSDIFTYNHTLLESYYTKDGLGNWEQYVPSQILNDERFDVGKGVYCPEEFEEDSRPNGWYYDYFRYRHSIDITPENGQEYPWSIAALASGFLFHDQFLVIDGRRIDFSKLWNINKNFNLTERPFSEPGKKGKIEKLEMDFSYLGKNFHGEHIDSIYVEK